MISSKCVPLWKPVGIAAAITLISLAALTATAAIGESTGNAISDRVDDAALDQFGKFEVLDPSALGPQLSIGSADALSAARKNEYGRPGIPQASLLRVTDADLGVVPLEKGRVVWIYRWTGLGDEYPKAFPPVEGDTPNETVFVLDDYFLLVDAQTGEVIASIQH